LSYNLTDNTVDIPIKILQSLVIYMLLLTKITAEKIQSKRW